MSAAEGRWSRKTAQSLVIQRAVDMENGGKRDAPEAASRIITVALNDLAKKHGLPPFTEPEDHAAPTLRHVIETDGARFVLAYDRERPVGFGAGLVRDAFSYCAGLFVLPEWQGRGLGRRLFETALEGLPITGGITALTSGAANPISNRLYARHGIYPQLALLVLSGPTAAAGGPPASHARGLDVEPLEAEHVGELRAIDEVALGFDRTPDHLWFLSRPGHPGWLFRRRGRPIGYGYLGGDETEGPGSVGPVATLRPSRPSRGFALRRGRARRAWGGAGDRRRPGTEPHRPARSLGGRVRVRGSDGPAVRLTALRPLGPLRAGGRFDHVAGGAGGPSGLQPRQPGDRIGASLRQPPPARRPARRRPRRPHGHRAPAATPSRARRLPSAGSAPRRRRPLRLRLPRPRSPGPCRPRTTAGSGSCPRR